MEGWPINPLDRIIQWIRTKPKTFVVADMGCGEARLARSLKNKVHSFDLVDNSSNIANQKPVKVVACDIAHVPLADCSVDIVVFCLSLMGTNIVDFVKEAHRILKPGGTVKIAEVRSRFHNIDGAPPIPSKGGNNRNSISDDSKGINDFVDIISGIGFDLNQTGCDIESNKMFFFLECVKTATENEDKKEVEAEGEDSKFSAKPCLYKRR